MLQKQLKKSGASSSIFNDIDYAANEIKPLESKKLL